jgi:WXG100 family type VII secretion target
MDPLQVSTEALMSAAVAARSHADSMNRELDDVARRVDDLLDVWKGGAATSYGDSWRDLHTAVRQIIDELSSIGDGLGVSARQYTTTDSGAAGAIEKAASVPRLNL